MPTAMTFTSLQEDIRRYLERGEITDPSMYAQLPRLINNAEREIAQDLKILGFLIPMTADFVAGTSVYAKPDRWRSTASMEIGIGTDFLERKQLFPRAYEYCRKYWPNSDLHGEPLFYADYDYEHWLIAPTPLLAYPWQINVYCMPPLLDDVTQTNWLTEYAPTLLLYRVLMESEPFIKKDERMPLWKGMYADSKAAINIQDLQRIIDRTTARERN